MKVVLHFTHTDLDALGCAAIVNTAFKYSLLGEYMVCTYYCNNSDVDIIIARVVDKLKKSELIYDDIPIECKDITNIFVTDIGIKEDTADLLENLVDTSICELVGIDHHISNKLVRDWFYIIPDIVDINEAVIKSNSNGKYLSFNKWMTCDKYPMYVSATAILFSYMIDNGYYNNIKNTIDGISHYKFLLEICTRISLYDTWEWKKQQSFCDEYHITELASVVSQLGLKKSEKILDVSNKAEYIDMISGYLEILNAQFNKALDSAFKNYKIYNRVGIMFPDTNINISMLHDKIHEKYNISDKVDYTVFVYVNTNTVSLRTIRDDIDLSKIAMKYGGGGHKKAAGFTAPNSLIMNYLSSFMLGSSMSDLALHNAFANLH